MSTKSYSKYLESFNQEHTDFRYTATGPIAYHKGQWYSINGSPQNITDVRYALNDKELKELNLRNENSPQIVWDY
jgi:hypothetical protein